VDRQALLGWFYNKYKYDKVIDPKETWSIDGLDGAVYLSELVFYPSSTDHSHTGGCKKWL